MKSIAILFSGLLISSMAFADVPAGAKACIVTASGAVQVTVSCDGAKVDGFVKPANLEEGMSAELGHLLTLGFKVQTCTAPGYAEGIRCVLTR